MPKPGRLGILSRRAWGIPFAGGASPLPWVKYPGCCSYARCSVAESLLRLVIACSTVISLPLALVAFVPKTRKKKWVRNPDLILGTPKTNWTVRSLLVPPKSGPESEPPHENANPDPAMAMCVRSWILCGPQTHACTRLRCPRCCSLAERHVCTGLQASETGRHRQRG